MKSATRDESGHFMLNPRGKGEYVPLVEVTDIARTLQRRELTVSGHDPYQLRVLGLCILCVCVCVCVCVCEYV